MLKSRARPILKDTLKAQAYPMVDLTVIHATSFSTPNFLFCITHTFPKIVVCRSSYCYDHVPRQDVIIPGSQWMLYPCMHEEEIKYNPVSILRIVLAEQWATRMRLHRAHHATSHTTSVMEGWHTCRFLNKNMYQLFRLEFNIAICHIFPRKVHEIRMHIQKLWRKLLSRQ